MGWNYLKFGRVWYNLGDKYNRGMKMVAKSFCPVAHGTRIIGHSHMVVEVSFRSEIKRVFLTKRVMNLDPSSLEQ